MPLYLISTLYEAFFLYTLVGVVVLVILVEATGVKQSQLLVFSLRLRLTFDNEISILKMSSIMKMTQKLKMITLMNMTLKVIRFDGLNTFIIAMGRFQTVLVCIWELFLLKRLTNDTLTWSIFELEKMFLSLMGQNFARD